MNEIFGPYQELEQALSAISRELALTRKEAARFYLNMRSVDGLKRDYLFQIVDPDLSARLEKENDRRYDIDQDD